MNIMASVSQWERETISERTAIALRYKRARRRVFNHEPYGYSRAADQLKPVAEEQAMIGQMKQWRGAGWTLRQIADHLNSLGTPTKRGRGMWYPQTVKDIVGRELHHDAAA
jgi:DNA invertase Pin-like site-specific DNA recombinase